MPGAYFYIRLLILGPDYQRSGDSVFQSTFRNAISESKRGCGIIHDKVRLLMAILYGEALSSQGSFQILMMLWFKSWQNHGDNGVGETHPGGSHSPIEQPKHHLWLHGMGDATDIFIPLETALKYLNLVQLEGHSEMLDWNPSSLATKVVTDTPFIASPSLRSFLLNCKSPIYVETMDRFILFHSVPLDFLSSSHVPHCSFVYAKTN